MARVDLQIVGSSKASIQLYHTTRRHVQVESDLHLVGRSRLPSACEKLLGMNSLSVYLSMLLDLFLYILLQFLSALKMGAVCLSETFVLTNQVKHGVMTQKIHMKCQCTKNPTYCFCLPIVKFYEY